MTRVLLLIPSRLKGGADYDAAVAAGEHPRMDYRALEDALCGETGASDVDVLGYGDLEDDPRLRALKKTLGADFALAALGAARAGEYDAVFTNGENVAVPLALLWRAAGREGRGRRPAHVTIGHRLTTPKKQAFFGPLLGADRGIDRIFVYASTQHAHAVGALGMAPEKAPLIAFHADTRFWRPLPEVEEDPSLVASAGLEWRDYPTLIRAARRLPNVAFRFAAASPWSKHTNETEKGELPPNVEARRYDYHGLRDLYARAGVVAVPLYENDFQAGVTTLLEAMAMGKAVVVTQTTGQTDVVTDGENGLTVPPGDADAWVGALSRLRADAALRRRLGAAARAWVEENATLDRWATRIARTIEAAARDAARPSSSAPPVPVEAAAAPAAVTPQTAFSRR